MTKFPFYVQLIAACALIAWLSACNSTPTPTPNTAVPSEPENPMLTYCQAYSCRENVKVLLATVDGEAQLEADYFWPVVRDNDILVLAGERIFVEAQLDPEGQISNFVFVAENQNPEHTFEINFQQTRGSYGMYFTVRNPFSYPVHFDVALTDTQGKTQRIGSCPVRGKRSYLERLPNPAFKLTLSNPRVLPEHAAIVCIG
jgi:hypothetical protein